MALDLTRLGQKLQLCREQFEISISELSQATCSFSCTRFVVYECLHKPRKRITEQDSELQRRLRRAQRNGHFEVYHLDIEDLLEIEVLRQRKNLGKGELSSIAFARRTRQVFMTDDRGAINLATQVMEDKLIQTTPHLLSWLFYGTRLGDQDKDTIIEQHTIGVKKKILSWSAGIPAGKMPALPKHYLNVYSLNRNLDSKFVN